MKKTIVWIEILFFILTIVAIWLPECLVYDYYGIYDLTYKSTADYDVLRKAKEILLLVGWIFTVAHIVNVLVLLYVIFVGLRHEQVFPGALLIFLVLSLFLLSYVAIIKYLFSGPFI